MTISQYLLGSRSPRRKELLELLIPADRIRICPPGSAEEAGFSGLTSQETIAARLQEIVAAKRLDVMKQQFGAEQAPSLSLVADTIIVARQPEGSLIVLEQPPAQNWQPVVREWFKQYYSGQTHEAWTGICLWNHTGILAAEIVTTEVTFRRITPAEIDWYLSTGESLGKAGGYAIQGLASLFVTHIAGSLTNVIGLPLEVVQRVVTA